MWCGQSSLAWGMRMQRPRNNPLWTKPLEEEFVSSDLHEQALSKRRHYLGKDVGSVRLSGVNSMFESGAIASRMHDGTACRV